MNILSLVFVSWEAILSKEFVGVYLAKNTGNPVQYTYYPACRNHAKTVNDIVFNIIITIANTVHTKMTSRNV